MYQHVHRSQVENPPSIVCQPKKKATREVGERAPWTNDNILQTSSQGWVVTKPQIRVWVHKVFEMEIHYSEWNYDSF
jgi:hypothetical protein